MHKHLLAAVLSLAVAMTGASALEAHAKTTFVTIGTGGITGVYYPTGGAIAKIVNAKKDKYDIRATVESTGASVFNINAIMAGDLEFGIAQADRQYQAYNGLSEWEGKPQKDSHKDHMILPLILLLHAGKSDPVSYFFVFCLVCFSRILRSHRFRLLAVFICWPRPALPVYQRTGRRKLFLNPL